MKQILLAMAAVAVLGACEKTESQLNASKITKKTNEPCSVSDKVVEFQYKGHDYIRFTKNEGLRMGLMGVVHSPDCKKCYDKFD